ncbi:ATP-binding protein [Pseudosporangium ferrugineum]|uniref:histidine kinase n=1 Tax=Pseudosporangium ferrugineum TaxID=439699 RepID=A0A2T0RL97_9ACTN|nr:ATP-binding protein [Pseudosporangium ferrugineum]PRY21969.1 HAMP domain-containing protein [Pseudosporangium ferrugineum]
MATPRDRSVGRLLTRAFGALVVLIVSCGAAETTALLMQHRVVDELSTHVQPLELTNSELRSLLADAQRGLRGYLLTGDGQLLDAYHEARSDYAVVGARLRGTASSRESGAVARQLARADAWWALAEEQRLAAPRSETAVGYVAQGKPLFQDFTAENRALDAELAARAVDLQKRSSRLSTVTTAVVIVLTLLAAVTAILAAVVSTRRITGPLDRVVAIIGRRRSGELDIRADATDGPTEIRAVAQAVNEMAEEGDRIRGGEKRDAARRAEVRELGYRIRAHLKVEEAIQEAVSGLATIIGADHVLVRMAPGQTEVPALASLRDEHVGGVLKELADCDVSWLRSGGVWASGEDAPDDRAAPPEAELLACAAAGAGPALTVAVSGGDECLGALTLIRDTGPAWTSVEMRLAESVAADLGRGVHHARLFEREQHLVARLQELDTAKTDFMSTVSHELRTPLTSIAGYVELLLDGEAGELGPQQRRMLEVIGRNSRRLRELIEDMLILSKIESGAFHPSRRPVDLVVLAEQAVAAIAPAAAKGRVVVRTEVERPLLLDADPDQLDRVLMNLLSNAVKFTPADGAVTLAAHRDGDEVRLSVADTGMGIPPAEQQSLFARFFRATNAIHRAIPGTGLGLAIVRTIVDNHGGRIAVDSTEGAGTTVTVRLPLR